jgi:Zinc finger, C2H2 type
MKTHEEGAKKSRRSGGKAKNKEDSFKRCHKCTHPGCGKSYRNEATLEAHMRTHEGNAEGDGAEKGAGEANVGCSK